MAFTSWALWKAFGDAVVGNFPFETTGSSWARALNEPMELGALH